jgi:hypothetical protein
MEPRNILPLSAYELRLVDSDLAHLQSVVRMVTTESNRALPLSYWRQRIGQILRTRHLIPAQLAIASTVLAQLSTESDMPELFGQAS